MNRITYLLHYEIQLHITLWFIFYLYSLFFNNKYNYNILINILTILNINCASAKIYNFISIIYNAFSNNGAINFSHWNSLDSASTEGRAKEIGIMNGDGVIITILQNHFFHGI